MKTLEQLQEEKKELQKEESRQKLELEVKNLRKKTKKKSIFGKVWDKI